MTETSGQLDEAGTTVTASLERYDGALRLRVAEGRIDGFRQTPPMRLFRPHPEPGEPRSVVVGNVAGGVVGGDRLGVRIEVAENESLLATTQAAEKIYRSDGATATMGVDLSVADGGTLEWLSAGTILFDGARLDRTTTLDVAAAGRLLYCETLVLGRLARGEVFASGTLRDRIRLRRGGRLVWADDLGLVGDGFAALDAAAGFAGGRSYSTILFAAPRAATALEAVRPLLEAEPAVRAGVTALAPDLLLVRILAGDPAQARKLVAATWMGLRSGCLGRPAQMPTIWAI
ncbi:urease accessory protein UreD [Thalassobaculum fulvum]|uniref:Urease accessory protein UreD n=1 Tax=Thalassobaculum fulvum TaxID=1633335 RepID=A0A918XT47_9PROT|nr:urease accessory protein UreD [Thalassobaculum fulvum]GHD52003.1 urease accessory protein UreD [Thalassobaculum fulvum]